MKIIKVPINPKRSLGDLRNIAIENAEGQYICQWDDDDWYNCNRLLFQYSIIIESNSAGSILKQWLLFDSTTNIAYVSHIRNWEGSILCETSVMKSRGYEDKTISEDTALIEHLFKENKLTITDNPQLYIYIYHGLNTWNYTHFKEIFDCSRELSKSESELINNILQGKYNIVEGSALLESRLKLY